MSEVIGARHQFHDREFAAGWADRFVPTPERLELFDLILSQLRSQTPSSDRVVELGIGPGYLADHLLKAMPEVHYYGVDFSGPMLDIARQRLRPYSGRIAYVQADLVKDDWWSALPTPVGAIVSSWTLHDLGSQDNVELVYKSCAGVLREGGILLNGDFIKPDEAIFEYEPGRFEIARHIELMRTAGFEQAECLMVFEEEIASPTAAQNYACFRGVVRKASAALHSVSSG